MSAIGKFVWHDLMTTDLDAAQSFYGEVLGWHFKGGDHGYQHIMLGERDIGGMMKLEPGQPPLPFWMGYVSVGDVDAAVTAIGAAGGKLVLPRTAVPGTGSFAIAIDPQGAVFAPFAYEAGHAALATPESSEPPAPGNFCWDELMSPDPEAAARFYGPLFGWGTESMDMPGFGRYTLFKRTGVKDASGAERSAAGLMALPPGVPHPSWLTYIAVADTDRTLERASRMKATVTSPAVEVAGVGRFATLLDPQGGAFAVLAPPR